MINLSSDSRLPVPLTDNDEEMWPPLLYTNFVLQVLNGIFVNFIAMSFNAFLFVWLTIVIYRLRGVNLTLELLRRKPRDPAQTRGLLIECYKIHLETIE